MGEQEKEPKIPALPLQAWLADRGRGSKAWFASKMDLTPGQLANWFRRGIPEAKVMAVGNMMGTDYEGYLVMAGVRKPIPKQADTDEIGLLIDFRALPPGLRAHLARKASELNELYSKLPEWIKRGMENPPIDPEAYKQWEADIEAMIARYQGPDQTPPKI